MASPQTENGYTKIANELLEAILKAGLSAVEMRVVFWVARNSYGWSSRKTKKVGLREMSRQIDSKHPSVHLALQVLIDQGIVCRDETGRYSINKDYESWLSGQPTDQKTVSPLTSAVSPLTTSGQPTDRNGQSTDHSVVEPKESKERLKASIKGDSAQNGDTYIPTFSEITAYANEIGKRIDCRRFFDHYSANGWTRGKARIADWKAVVRLWEDDGSASPSPPKKQPRCHRCRTAAVFDGEKFCLGECRLCSQCRDVSVDLAHQPKSDLWLCASCLPQGGVSAVGPRSGHPETQGRALAGD
jgi:phage replication O-like protein O